MNRKIQYVLFALIFLVQNASNCALSNPLMKVKDDLTVIYTYVKNYKQCTEQDKVLFKASLKRVLVELSAAGLVAGIISSGVYVTPKLVKQVKKLCEKSAEGESNNQEKRLDWQSENECISSESDTETDFVVPYNSNLFINDEERTRALQEQAIRKQQEAAEQERIVKEQRQQKEEERKRLEEAKRLKTEEVLKRFEEECRQKKAEEKRKREEIELRQRQAEEERNKREADRRRREEEERKRQMEIELLHKRQAEEERIKREADRKRKEEEERHQKEQAELLHKEKLKNIDNHYQEILEKLKTSECDLKNELSKPVADGQIEQRLKNINNSISLSRKVIGDAKNDNALGCEALINNVIRYIKEFVNKKAELKASISSKDKEKQNYCAQLDSSIILSKTLLAIEREKEIAKASNNREIVIEKNNLYEKEIKTFQANLHKLWQTKVSKSYLKFSFVVTDYKHSSLDNLSVEINEVINGLKDTIMSINQDIAYRNCGIELYQNYLDFLWTQLEAALSQRLKIELKDYLTFDDAQQAEVDTQSFWYATTRSSICDRKEKIDNLKQTLINTQKNRNSVESRGSEVNDLKSNIQNLEGWEVRTRESISKTQQRLLTLKQSIEKAKNELESEINDIVSHKNLDLAQKFIQKIEERNLRGNITELLKAPQDRLHIQEKLEAIKAARINEYILGVKGELLQNKVSIDWDK